MSSLELLFMIGVGDFCMNPTKSVVNALEPNSDLWKTAKYYSTCSPTNEYGNGDNLMHEGLYIAYEKRRQLGLAIQSLYMPIDTWEELHPGVEREGGPICGPVHIDHDTEDAFYELQALAPQFQQIARMISCTELHMLWRVAFEVAACSDIMLGVFSLWWSQLLCMAGGEMHNIVTNPYNDHITSIFISYSHDRNHIMSCHDPIIMVISYS